MLLGSMHIKEILEAAMENLWGGVSGYVVPAVSHG